MQESEMIAEMSFEAALQRLEVIVRQLESGDAPLEAAIDLYAEARKLKIHCEEKLSAAEARIAQLQLDGEGRVTGEGPFSQ